MLTGLVVILTKAYRCDQRVLLTNYMTEDVYLTNLQMFYLANFRLMESSKAIE